MTPAANAVALLHSLGRATRNNHPHRATSRATSAQQEPDRPALLGDLTRNRPRNNARRTLLPIARRRHQPVAGLIGTTFDAPPSPLTLSPSCHRLLAFA